MTCKDQDCLHTESLRPLEIYHLFGVLGFQERQVVEGVSLSESLKWPLFREGLNGFAQ